MFTSTYTEFTYQVKYDQFTTTIKVTNSKFPQKTWLSIIDEDKILHCDDVQYKRYTEVLSPKEIFNILDRNLNQFGDRTYEASFSTITNAADELEIFIEKLLTIPAQPHLILTLELTH